MSLIFRLASNRLGSQFLRNDRGHLFSITRLVPTKVKKAAPLKEEGHDERNMRLKRPQSPHLSIYAPQLTAVLSISHRATGMMLSGYAMMFALAAVVLPESIPHYIEDIECAEIGEVVISGIKFMLVFPLTYHFWNGIRHLLWDAGMFLSIKPIYITGYIMLLLALSSATLLSII